MKKSHYVEYPPHPLLVSELSVGLGSAKETRHRGPSPPFCEEEAHQMGAYFVS
jgi:hypothetical protein